MLNLSNGKVYGVTYSTLICEASYVLIDGDIIAENAKQKAVTLATQKVLSDLGYADFNGVGSENGGHMIDFVEVVGSKAYLSITRITRDKSADLGWRQGYRREKTVVYVTEIESDILTPLYEY